MKKSGEISINNVKEWIWAKYIENEPDVACPLSDEEMLAFLEEHYSSTPPESDPEIFYFGVLLFEMAYEVENESTQEAYFIRSKRMLELYRHVSGERDWDAVEDRLEDIDATLESKGITPAMIEAAQVAEASASAARMVELEDAAPDGMVLVQAGVIHRPGSEEGVRVDAFYLDRLPVTNKDYLEFVKATGYRPPKYLEDEEMAQPGLPVVGVSFYDAVQFATWAGKLLPSSDQWTLAATGGDKVRYPWGDEFRKEFAVYAGNAKGIEPVGEREGNVSNDGVHDLVGNKWEWTSTWFDEKEEYKIIRGGAWCDPPEFLSVDVEMYASPKEKIDILGFRCCRLP